MFGINHDNLFHIFSFLDSCILISTCSLVCKEWFGILMEDSLFELIANREWGFEFWERAQQREHVPHTTFRKELLRINNFQQFLEYYGLPRWMDTDFYAFWYFYDSR